MTGAAAHDSFLTLAEAAGRLGLSRLKLREAIAKGLIPARRDNEGRWRVDLTGPAPDLGQAPPAPPEALMAVLFDEIEELTADLDAAQDASARWAALAAAQDGALAKAAAALDTVAGERDRLADLTGRALAAAEAAEGRAQRLQVTADRALVLLDRATGAMEAMQGEIAALRTDAGAKAAAIAAHGEQLNRLFSLSEQALDKAAQARRAPSLLARVFGGRKA